MATEAIRSAMLLFTQASLRVLSQGAKAHGVPVSMEQHVDFTSPRGLSAPWVEVPMFRYFIHARKVELRGLPEAGQVIDLLREAEILEPLQIFDGENRPLVPTEDQLDGQIYSKLSGFLCGYVEALGSFDYSAEEFELSYQDFLQTWTSGRVPHQVVSPLLFFSSEKYPIELGNDLSIVPLTAENKSALWKHSPFTEPHLTAHHWAQAEAAVIGHYLAPSAISSGSRIPQSISELTLALRILHTGDVFPGAYYDIPLSRDTGRLFRSGRLDSWRPLPRTPTPYWLPGADHERLRSIVSTLSRCRVAGQLKDLGVAIRRFEEAYRRSNPEDQIIDLTIGLESTLLFGLKDELKFRLALRGSTLLRQEYPAEKTFKLLRTLYDVRSGIVHGGKSLRDFAKEGLIAGFPQGDFVSIVLDWYRRMLRHLLKELDAGANLKTIIDDLDGSIITALDQ